MTRVLLAAVVAVVGFALGAGQAGSETPAPQVHRLVERERTVLELRRRVMVLERRLVRVQGDRTRFRRGLLKARRVFRQSLGSSPVGAHPFEVAFQCIHRYEGSWTDPNPPYWGGLQMDRSFMQSYGGWAVQAFGTADRWPVSVQISVAIRALVSGRGFYPWPNTARRCGLL